jgi:uncharacterized protein YodC (DUF2158 family)
MQIETGNVVRLNDSKELMTVEAIDGVAAKCVWFDENSNLHSRTFSVNELVFVRT